jgi:hypothetical protein
LLVGVALRLQGLAELLALNFEDLDLILRGGGGGEGVRVWCGEGWGGIWRQLACQACRLASLLRLPIVEPSPVGGTVIGLIPLLTKLCYLLLQAADLGNPFS